MNKDFNQEYYDNLLPERDCGINDVKIINHKAEAGSNVSDANQTELYKIKSCPLFISRIENRRLRFLYNDALECLKISYVEFLLLHGLMTLEKATSYYLDRDNLCSDKKSANKTFRRLAVMGLCFMPEPKKPYVITEEGTRVYRQATNILNSIDMVKHAQGSQDNAEMIKALCSRIDEIELRLHVGE